MTSACSHIESSACFPPTPTSSSRCVVRVWHSRPTPGSRSAPAAPKHAGHGRKVKLANRNVTQSLLRAFLSLAFPTTYNEKFSLPKYCLNFKYTISPGVTRWKEKSGLQRKTSMRKLRLLGQRNYIFIELLEMTVAHDGNQAPSPLW